MKPILKYDNLCGWLRYYLKQNLLPKKVVERIASGVDFRDHFIEVVAEFVYTHFLLC